MTTTTKTCARCKGTGSTHHHWNEYGRCFSCGGRGWNFTPYGKAQDFIKNFDEKMAFVIQEGKHLASEYENAKPGSYSKQYNWECLEEKREVYRQALNLKSDLESYEGKWTKKDLKAYLHRNKHFGFLD